MAHSPPVDVTFKMAKCGAIMFSICIFAVQLQT
jgi:hypothetical protein